MDIIVCIKQVPDTSELRIDPVTGNLIREGVPGILNPEDKHAVEAAVCLKEKHGGHVTAITMGPPQAEEALRECLAMGADRAILLTDRAFSGADTCATSYTLSRAVQKVGKFDLILCGRQALDGNTAQVGPQLAELLGIPQITYVQSMEVDGHKARVRKALEDGYEILEGRLPLLLTVTKDTNVPRVPAIDAIIASCAEDKVITWTAEDLDIDKALTGLKGSPTRIRRAFTPETKSGRVEMLEGSAEEAVKSLVSRLRGKHLLEEA